MIHTPPRRLVDDADFEFGEALRDVMEETRISPETLERNRPPAKVSAPVPAATTIPGGATAAALAALALAIALMFARSETETSVRPAPATTASSAPAETAAPVATATPAAAAFVPPMATTATAAPRETVRESRRGTLAEELRLLESARDALRRGAHEDAIAALDELAREYPATRLAPEAGLQRVRVLVAAERGAEAIPLLQEIAEASRRPDLFRWLGDLHLAAKDCAPAATAYERAHREGLADDEARHATAALAAACPITTKQFEGTDEERE